MLVIVHSLMIGEFLNLMTKQLPTNEKFRESCNSMEKKYSQLHGLIDEKVSD